MIYSVLTSIPSEDKELLAIDSSDSRIKPLDFFCVIWTSEETLKKIRNQNENHETDADCS